MKELHEQEPQAKCEFNESNLIASKLVKMEKNSWKMPTLPLFTMIYFLQDHDPAK